MVVKGRLDDLLLAVEALAGAREQDLEVDCKTRERLYSAARKLMLRTESATETMHRIDMGPIQIAVVKIGFDVNLWESIVEQKKSTISELAYNTGVHPDLLCRLLKFCAAHGMISEVGPDRYKPNNITRSFMGPGYKGAVIAHHATTTRAAQALPAFLQNTNYMNPTDGKNCALQHGIGCGDTYFEFLKKNPAIASSFHEYMKATRMSQQDLGELYDFKTLWGKNTDDTTVLFVDVGGGNGQQCLSLLRTGRAKGRFILQDLPAVTENLNIDDVEAMGHDFFRNQPIKGAKAYYFRTILHDWPDHDCLRILRNIHDAMGDDSVVLLDERLIDNQDAHWIAMNMDLAMMLMFAGVERTEKQWVNLLAEAGLKIKTLNVYSPSGNCIIEAVKA